jgi:hypothetical protein
MYFSFEILKHCIQCLCVCVCVITGTYHLPKAMPVKLELRLLEVRYLK